MASPLQQMNSGRRPVVVYAPGRGAAPSRPRVGPQRAMPLPSRVARAAPSSQRGAAPAGGNPWAGLTERVTSTKAAQDAAQQQAQQQAEDEQGGFWGSDFGKGLGFVINNPLTRTVAAPLGALQTLARAGAYGLESAAEGQLEAPEWLDKAIAATPVLGPLLNVVDTNRTKKDDRSFTEKVLKPTSDYSYGSLLYNPPEDAPGWQKNLGRATGLFMDVAYDPLSYVGGGATRAVTKASSAARAAQDANAARVALQAAEKGGDASKIAALTERATQLGDEAARLAEIPEANQAFKMQMPMPRNRAERANWVGELARDPKTSEAFQQFQPELQRGGLRGFQTMPAEARQAFGISEPGLRLRGVDTPLPGTRRISRGINEAGGRLRAGIAKMPGANSKLANVRVPKGLEDAYSVLTRGRAGDVELAALDVGVRNEIRQGSGAFVGRANRTLTKAVKDSFKGLNENEKRLMMAAAEESAEPNAINKIFASILDVYQRSTGRIIDERFLRDPNTYVPHKMDPKFRRVLANMMKENDKAATDFMEAAGFYKDDLLEGSGFLERSRKLEPNADGTPRVVNIAGKEVTIDSGTINGLNNNKSLRDAFPNYDGKFFDDDPTRIAESYITSLGRQAGRDKAVKSLLESGTKKVRTMEGALDETRQAMNEALALKDEGALLRSAEQPYVKGQPVTDIPEQPVVPGSQFDKNLRAAEAAQSPPVAEGKVRLYRGDPATPLPSLEEAAAAREANGTGWLNAQPEIQARNAVRGRWFHPDLETAAKYPMNRDPGELNRIRYIDIPEADLPKYRQWDEATGGLSRDPQEVLIPEDLMDQVGDFAAPPVRPPAERFGNVDPNDYFRTTVGTEATAARYRQAKGTGRRYAQAAAKDANATEKAIREGLYDIRESMVKPLRGTIKEQTAQITAWNKQIRKYGERLHALGPLTSDNFDELLALNAKIDADIIEMEANLRRRASSWKGRSTKAQKKVESQVRTTLEHLKAQRDLAQRNVTGSSEAMKAEYATRLERLNKGVRDATETLLRREMMVPVPHNQARVNEAREALGAVLGGGERSLEDVEKYLKGYRDVVAEAKEGARATVGAADPSDVMARERQVYGNLLEQIREIGSRRKRGRLTKADQQLMDEAVAMRNRIRNALGQGKPSVGGAATEHDEVLSELAMLRDDIRRGVYSAESMPAARAHRDKLARQFRPGGKFYEQTQARQVLSDMTAYEDDVARLTQRETKALEEAQRLRAQQPESIIWGNEPRAGGETERVRYFGEDEGFGVGQRRIPTEVTTPPQPEAFDVDVSPTGRIRAPRREEEALASLKGRADYGSAAEQEARRLETKVAKEEATLPGRVTEARATAAAEVGAKADAELGPLAKEVGTFKNLASDMADKTKIVKKRDELRGLRDRLNKANPKYRKNDLANTIDEIEAVAVANPLVDDAKLAQTESILQTHRNDLERVNDTRFRVRQLDKARADAESGKLAKVMIATLNDNWRTLHNGPVNTGDVIMDAELHKRFTNLFELNKEPGLFGRTFNAGTDLFKTYATLSPGFHVRNTIGGIFMNSSDGVKLTHQLDGFTHWQKFLKGGDEWLEQQPQHIKDAFDATFTSGPGGRFEDAGVLARTNSKLYNVASSNPITRWSQRQGTRVEGGMRLGMALDSIANGQSVDQAVSRISRVHFDYAQVSQLDETMKRIIPFWTFMSRNLPLQIQQQWTNPRVYAYYSDLVRNFSLPDEEFTPDYWKRQGAWRTPLSVGGMPIYAQPDLGFNRVGADIEMFSKALGEGDWGALLSQGNPLVGATVDYLQKRDSFYGRTFDETDYKKMSGPVGTPMSWIAKLFPGGTNEEGQVSENLVNYITSLVPPVNQAMRLMPEAAGGDTSADTWMKRLRYAGVPAQLLTPAAQDSEYWRQWFEMQDEVKRQQAMAREAVA